METNFENFYDKFDQSEFEETWENIHKEKKKSLKIALICVLIMNIAFGGFFFHCIDDDIMQETINVVHITIATVIFSLIIDGFIVGLIQALAGTKYKVEYSRLYKERLIKSMLCNFFSDVEYYPYNGINRDIYNSGLYNEYYNEYESDDCVEAVIDNKNAIRLAEVHTVDVQTHRNSGGSSHTTRTTKFYGLFAQINIDTYLDCSLRIRPHDFWKNGNEVEMDSNEFQKIFDVESKDRIKAMQFLTHDVMEELISFKKYLGSYFDIYITGNSIYIRLHVGNLFESVIDKKEVIYKKTAERYFNILQFFYNLSKKIIAISEENKY